MDNLNRVEHWYGPTDLLRKETGFACEMSREDHGFLSGIIKLVQPKKVLEVGVAEGGTTAVIVKSLEMLGLSCDMLSVDLNEQLWCDKSLETGYIYKKQKRSENVNHTFLFGKTIAGRLEEYGGDIDLVVLDTTHSVPGEILDFLSVLPFLSKNGMVVLHDVNLNYDFTREKGLVNYSLRSVATKIVYTTAVAEKYYDYDYNGNRLYNIAALKINEDTHKYIIDMFVSLSHIWTYSLDDQLIQEYRNLFIQHYSPQCVEIFDICVKNESDYRANIRKVRGILRLERTIIGKMITFIVDIFYKS